jgi:excisionase family DNA binding protein
MPLSKPAVPAVLLTPDEAADVLALSRELVIKFARAGKIPAIKLGKAWRFRLPAIEAWLKEQEQAA